MFLISQWQMSLSLLLITSTELMSHTRNILPPSLYIFHYLSSIPLSFSMFHGGIETILQSFVYLFIFIFNQKQQLLFSNVSVGGQSTNYQKLLFQHSALCMLPWLFQDGYLVALTDVLVRWKAFHDDFYAKINLSHQLKIEGNSACSSHNVLLPCCTKEFA